MAAPTIRAKSTAAITSFGPTAYIDITKPTGLAVGDLMVTCIGMENHGSDPWSSAPAGWTLLKSQLGASNCAGAVYWKIADSSDTAASTFRFSEASGGTDGIGGIMYAITGGTFDPSNPFSASASDNDSTSSTPTYTCPITPTADNLLIAFFPNFEAAGGAPSTSSCAIATSNPTWTEDLDQNRNGGGYYYMNACYSAPRTQSTSTGNVTVSYAGGGSWYGSCILLGIQPPQTAVKSINGLAKASVKTVNGLAIASVKTVNGLA